MAIQPLGQEQIHVALAALDGWEYADGKLRKEFVFSSFREAIAFIVRLAFHAEELNHHPDIRNVYDRVELTLNTHEAGGQVTERDVKLARTIEGFSWV